MYNEVEVKAILIAVEKLEMDEIVIDRPNYSQRIKLVKKWNGLQKITI